MLILQTSKLFVQKGLYLKNCDISDIPVLSVTGIESYYEHYLHLWTDIKYAHWYMNLSFSNESLDKQMRDTCTQFFLIYKEHIPAGIIKINNKGRSNKNDETELEKIYLLKKFTGQGIGTWALNRIIMQAKELKRKSLWLKSMDTSEAVKFYLKLGFSITGKLCLDFEGFKDQYRNMVIMQLNIS